MACVANPSWYKTDVIMPRAAKPRSAFQHAPEGSLARAAFRMSIRKQGARPTSVQVIERLVRLLDILSHFTDPVSLKTLSRAAALHPSTAHRILNDLVTARFVERIDTGSYQLGLRLLELGSLVKARLHIRDAAMGPMRELHQRTSQPINLSIRQGDEIVYVERALSERSGMQVVRAVGGRAPLHLTSVGKLFLAADEVNAVRSYAMRTSLEGYTANSITDLARLEFELAQVRRLGFARDNEELEPRVRCIAAGIYDDCAKLVAGLSISAPAEQVREEWVEWLRETTSRISTLLGHDGPRLRPLA
jgi:DNA-binding IclR family transcriptional regulator